MTICSANTENICSIHAEYDAMSKLPPVPANRLNKRLVKISLLVIRVSKNQRGYVLGNSRPCAKCIQDMYNIQSRGYKIMDVYYSDIGGNIICRKFENLLHDPEHHITRYYRNDRLRLTSMLPMDPDHKAKIKTIIPIPKTALLHQALYDEDDEP